MKRLLMGIVVLALGSVALSQDAPRQHLPSKAASKGLADKVEASSLASVMSAASCTNLSATLGVPVSGYLGPGDCSSYDPTYGTMYADFYAFSATANHVLQVTADSSTLSYLATIQSYSTGSVLASSDTCGYMQSTCTFTYTALSSTTYIMGIGAYGTGNYTLTVRDITSGGGLPGTPNLRPYKPSGWADKLIVTTVTPPQTLGNSTPLVDSTTITTTNTVYVVWAATNEGTVDIPPSIGTNMRNGLYLDGVRVHGWSGALSDGSNWQAGYWVGDSYSLGLLTAGAHTVEFRVDETNVVAESNENDNMYTKSFTVAGTAPPPAGALYLNGNRFKVTASYVVGTTPVSGTPVTLTSDTGYFWFFTSSNVELVIKVVDGRAFNGHYWVFAGGLTNVDCTITVTDTTTGATRTYRNPANTPFQPIQDVAAF